MPTESTRTRNMNTLDRRQSQPPCALTSATPVCGAGTCPRELKHLKPGVTVHRPSSCCTALHRVSSSDMAREHGHGRPSRNSDFFRPRCSPNLSDHRQCISARAACNEIRNLCKSRCRDFGDLARSRLHLVGEVLRLKNMNDAACLS